MKFSLLPRLRVRKLTDLEPKHLQERGIQLLMLDFDNTIVPYTTNEPSETTVAWFDTMKGAGISLCVVSNSKRDRVKIFCEKYGLDCITHAKKPFRRGIGQCLAKYGKSPEECAIAGDQIFTDTLGGNCAGLTSILVKPIHNHTIWLKLRHVAEQPFIFASMGRRLTK